MSSSPTIIREQDRTEWDKGSGPLREERDVSGSRRVRSWLPHASGSECGVAHQTGVVAVPLGPIGDGVS